LVLPMLIVRAFTEGHQADTNGTEPFSICKRLENKQRERPEGRNGAAPPSTCPRKAGPIVDP
jgi:hypothetical protein